MASSGIDGSVEPEIFAPQKLNIYLSNIEIESLSKLKPTEAGVSTKYF